MGSPLPGRPVWRRAGAESAESPSPNAAGWLCSTRAGVAAAVAAASERRRGKLAALAPCPTPLQLDNRFAEQLRGKCLCPTPILPRCQQPGVCVLSSGAGSSGGCGAENQNATLSRSSEANDDKQHSRPLRALQEPLIDPEGGGRARAWVYMALGCPALPAPPRGPRQVCAARRELLGAQSGAGCVRRRVRSVHFWALQDQQKPEKAPGMRSSDWPTRAWVGAGGGGQERGGRWKI